MTMVIITKSYLANAMLDIFHEKYFLAPQIELDDQITSTDNNSVRESSTLESSPFHIFQHQRKALNGFITNFCFFFLNLV